MARSLMIAVLLATTATNVQAQTSGGPPIAYAKVAGSGQEIYLVNPDGSGLKKIYATPAKRSVAWLDLKPGGGEVAWVEAGSGSPRQIKILSLDGAGNPVGSPRALVGPCAPDTVDYHPTGPLLIISDICSQNPRIASVGTDGTGYSILVSGSAYLNKARWLRDGVSYVYVRAPVDGGPLQICRNSCDPGQNELLMTVNGLLRMDVGRTAETIIFDDGGSYTTEIDAMIGAVLRSNFISGTNGHYSPDDSRILYKTPHQARGDYLQIYDSQSNSSARLTAKGDYSSTDWRN